MRDIREGESPGIAVIGSGYWGKNLVRNYHRLGVLRLICDRDEETLAGFREQYPGVEVCLSINDVLSRSDIEGVVIATPVETHFNVAAEALLADKHVYVEKPLVLHMKEGEELIRLSDERGRILMVGHLLQYHPAFIRLRELVFDGDLGRINYLSSNRLNFGKIRREENILWSFAPHDISMTLSLLDEEPEAVRALGANYLHRKIADVTTTHLEFPSGVKAHIFVSWLHPYKEQNLVVVGDRKMAVFNDTLSWPRKLCLYPHHIKWEKNMPVPEKAEPEYIPIEETEPLRTECLHFLHCIVSGERPRTDGREGLRVLKVLKASQDSMDRQGEKIVPGQPRGGPEEIGGAGSDACFVHPSSVIERDVEIGRGTRIWHFSHVLSGSRIGERCTLGQNVAVGPDVVVGDGCRIQNNVSVFKGITLEKDVFCGPSMVFTNVYNPRAEIRKMAQLLPTLVQRGATIGANATIICGITIGRYAFIGAGAVVTKDVPDYALVAGNPARKIGWVCRCGERLPPGLACRACGRQYEIKEGLLRES